MEVGGQQHTAFENFAQKIDACPAIWVKDIVRKFELHVKHARRLNFYEMAK
jgi:hypothetical protein